MHEEVAYQRLYRPCRRLSKDIRSHPELAKPIRTVIASKQAGSEDFLADMVAEAVLAVLPKNPTNFNVDNIRVVKIMGGSLEQSKVVKGMVFGRQPDGTMKKAKRAKVGVFSCPIDISQTETKGTVLLHNAKEMMDFTKGEEIQLETIIKELHDSGLRVVVAGGTIGELALHYLNRFGILVVKVLSKFELRRLCRVVGATPWLASAHLCPMKWEKWISSKRSKSVATALQYLDKRMMPRGQLRW